MFSSMVPLVSADESLIQSIFGNLNLNVKNVPAFVSSSFGATTTNNVGQILSTFLMIFIVVMLVYTILDSIKIFPKDKDWINWVVSIGIGALSFLFVTPDTIRSLTIQYEALGVVMVAILPAIIVILFSAKLKEKIITGTGNPLLENIVSTILPLLYIIYLSFHKVSYNITPIITTIHVVIILFMIAFVLAGSWFIRMANKYKLKQDLNAAGDSAYSSSLVNLLDNLKMNMERFGRATTVRQRNTIDRQYVAQLRNYQSMGGKARLPKSLL